MDLQVRVGMKAGSGFILSLTGRNRPSRGVGCGGGGGASSADATPHQVADTTSSQSTRPGETRREPLPIQLSRSPDASSIRP